MEDQRPADGLPVPGVRAFVTPFMMKRVETRVEGVSDPLLSVPPQGGVCRFLRHEPDPVGGGLVGSHALWDAGGHPGPLVLHLSAAHIHRSIFWIQEGRKWKRSDTFLTKLLICNSGCSVRLSLSLRASSTQ